MPKYLIAYRKTEESGQKPEWAVFTTDSELSLEAHAVKERVEKRMSVLGEKLWGNGEAVWIGNGRLDDVLYRRDELAPEFVTKVIARERPDAMLPTVGGQTALNLAVALAEDGTLDRYGVELIGAKLPAIKTAEDRNLFGAAMARIGLAMPTGFYTTSPEDALAGMRKRRMQFPLIIRPSFTLGGTGGSIAYHPEELEAAIKWGLQQSPLQQVLVEESVIGWKEFELEVMRDLKDNVVIICSIENFDPMGVHTGDSITVAPAQTLTDKEYQLMRDASLAIIRETPASFEPAIDYCVVKIPRWDFEKFPEADQTLTTQMKSVGEVMAIGRTFKEALQKAVRSLEQDRWGLTLDRPVADLDELRQKIRIPNADRVFAIGEAYRRGLGTREIHELSAIDPWFLDNIRQIVEYEAAITAAGLDDADVLRRAKQMGFSDKRIGQLTGAAEGQVRHARVQAGIKPVYKMVDTCAAEFVAHTPYLYSTYEEEDEAPPTPREKVVILGSGPNRIGQGIEFDYACVHAAFALREAGVEAIMVNCNPETVSTDYDTSDRLYFEPLTFEDVMSIVERERPR